MRNGELPETSARYLARILRHMKEGHTGTIEITLHCGGVRSFRESVSVQVTDLEEPAPGERVSEDVS